jgi:hypothetical protein
VDKILQQATGDSVTVMNESFNSTTLNAVERDGGRR